MKVNYKKKIGILGGSFDPSHKGHLKISIEAKKKFKINKIIWAITKKNPFKSKSQFTLKKRISLLQTKPLPTQEQINWLKENHGVKKSFKRQKNKGKAWKKTKTQVR